MNEADSKCGGAGVRQPLLLRADEVAHLVSISTRTLWRLVSSGQFPSPIYIGGSTRWRLSDIKSWVDECRSGGRRDLRCESEKQEPLRPNDG